MKTSALTVMLFLAGSAEAKHHHHHEQVLAASEEEAQDMETLNAMSTNKLVAGLRSTLDSALAAEARDDKAAAVAKTAAIKNIQKALTARILKRLDDGQPLVEVARKMKAIEGMQPQINDMERRLGIMQSVEPVLENAIKTLQKVVDVRGMGKKLVQIMSEEENSEQITVSDVNAPDVKESLDSQAMEKSKKDATSKAIKEGEDVMKKAAAAADKAAATAMSNVSKADLDKETKRAAKAASKKDTGACKTCEKVPLTKEEKKEDEAEKKMLKAEKEKADALEKEKEEEEKKKAEEDEDSDDEEAKDEKKEDKKDAKKEDKKDEKKEDKKDAKDAKKGDAKDAKDEKKDEKKDGKGKGKGKGKGGKKEEKKDDAKDEKKDDAKEDKKEAKLDKDGRPILDCKKPPAKKDVQTEDSESDSDDE